MNYDPHAALKFFKPGGKGIPVLRRNKLSPHADAMLTSLSARLA